MIFRAMTASIGNLCAADYLMQDVADSAMVPLVAKLKIQSTKNPNNDYWLYCLCVVYENKGAYKKAITYYTDCQKKNPSSITSYRISNCYSEIGDYASALQHIDNAIALDSTDYDNVMAKADILYESGDAKAAILELDKYVAHYPEYYGGYYRRCKTIPLCYEYLLCLYLPYPYSHSPKKK